MGTYCPQRCGAECPFAREFCIDLRPLRHNHQNKEQLELKKRFSRQEAVPDFAGFAFSFTSNHFSNMAPPIPPEQLQYYIEHADDNQQPNLIATVVLCLALPCIAVFLRFIARWRMQAGYKADDWLILLALVGSLLRNRQLSQSSNNITASMRRYVDHHRPGRPLW